MDVQEEIGIIFSVVDAKLGQKCHCLILGDKKSTDFLYVMTGQKDVISRPNTVTVLGGDMVVVLWLCQMVSYH